MKFVFMRHVKDAVKKRKKVLILTGMAMLLVVKGVLNYTLSKKTIESETASTSTTTSLSFFETYKTDRDSARASQLELLNEVINSSYATASEKATATASKTALAEKMEKEADEMLSVYCKIADDTYAAVVEKLR